MLYGHEDKKELFRRLAGSDSLGHAYLFYGSSGIGKFLFARTLAVFLESGEFDYEAAASAPLVDSNFFLPDEKGKIGVETARDIKKFLSGRPFKSSRRLAIIRDAEKLTPEAESALLKIVEEPPERAMIVFIAEGSERLFAPLVSRLTRVYFPSFSAEEIKKFLIGQYGISDSKAAEIAVRSFNRIGVAVGLYENKNAVLSGEKSLREELSEEIIARYGRGVIENSSILEKLLLRESVISRYNLNDGLQRKAIEYILGY